MAHLDHEWRGQGEAIYVDAYYDVIATRYADALRAKGYGAAVGKHADLSDTALMLAVDPTMVREEALRHASLPGVADGVYGAIHARRQPIWGGSVSTCRSRRPSMR